MQFSNFLVVRTSHVVAEVKLRLGRLCSLTGMQPVVLKIMRMHPVIDTLLP